MKLVGVLGGGQLGRMLGLAGLPLGCRFRFLDESEDSPAAAVGELLDGSFHDPAGLERFSQGLDVATYEFENVPATAVEEVARYAVIYPSVEALRVAQDRVAEKALFNQLGIPTPLSIVVDSDRSARDAAETLGCPVVFKTTRLGYDGKGQVVIRDLADALDVWSRLGKVPLIAEQFVEFERELSIIATRGQDGNVIYYPLTQNLHLDGILRFSLAPAPAVSVELQAQAERYVNSILQAFGYVGTIAVEFFQASNHLLANEIAPRVHNSGHWSIDGASVSQFENHLRAILGYSLGVPRMRGLSAMINLIGDVPEASDILAVENVRLHLYGKAPRKGRKVGHLNIVASDDRELAKTLLGLSHYLPESTWGALKNFGIAGWI